KSKEYSEDEYKDATEFEDEEETMDDMTEDELVAEDDDEHVTEGEDEFVAEDEGEDRDELVAEDEQIAEDEDELMVEDEHMADEHAADEHAAENDDDNGARPEVPIQRSKRGMRSIKSRSRNKRGERGASKSSVWDHFDTKTAKYPGRPVCKKCNAIFSAESGTSTLRRHLRYLDDVDRINIDDTMVLLSPIERATRLLSASSYPTHGDVQFVFLGIQEHLSRYINDESFSQHIVADAIYQKLSNYWPIMSKSSQISSLLDPRVKFSAFEDEIEKTNAKNLILNLAGYAFSLSPLPAETTPGNDIIETRSFF
ncbi:9475_t:CDS:2, partial [Rhizophagus irregularis]